MIKQQIQTIIKLYFTDNVNTINKEMLLFNQIFNTYIVALFLLTLTIRANKLTIWISIIKSHIFLENSSLK